MVELCCKALLAERTGRGRRPSVELWLLREIHQQEQHAAPHAALDVSGGA